MLAELTNTVQTSEIQLRIKALNDMSEADLRNEMRELKEVLIANPAACALLLDEDIGTMVTALRKITAKAMTASTEAKAKTTRASTAKPTVKKLTAAELAAALEDDDF